MQKLLFLASAISLVVSNASAYDILSRWTRQAVGCQPGDEACKKCSSHCTTIPTSQLPECCEAYDACCDQYFQACKQCSSIKGKDRFFPEYCCASFTSCCDLITTFTTEVKPPAPVRPKSKPDLKIPEVAAPKPSFFPGSNPVASSNQGNNQQQPNIFQNAGSSSEPVFSSQGPLTRPQESVFSSQKPVPAFPQEHSFDPRSPEPASREPAFAPRTPSNRQPGNTFTGQITVGNSAGSSVVDNSQRQRTRTQVRAQARPQTKERQQNSRRNNDLDPAARRGRVTSRGRVA